MSDTEATQPQALNGKAKKGKKNPPAQISPVDVFDATDPGDTTQRNFRYQHTYCVMLLVSGKLGLRPYVAIWCEQHEDCLAERNDAKFDAYQIKTSRPENGAWRLNDLELIKTIGRFAGLVAEFGEAIANLFFVSNTECDMVGDDNKNDRRRALCPQLFLQHIKACKAPVDIDEIFNPTFQDLQAECGCSEAILFRVLQRMNIILGPSRNEMDAALSHEHVAKLETCKTLNAEKLDEFRDHLVGKVYRAASLQVEDPIRHLRPVIGGKTDNDPRLVAKRLPVDQLVVYAVEVHGPKPFQYVGTAVIELGKERPPTILEQKLTAGGLAEEIDYMAERERAAERHLLEDLQRRPERYPELAKQIEQVVLGECREAHLRARMTAEPYGPAMLIDVQDRLRRISREETALVGDHSYECLIGMAGLLTHECVVWWSPRFDVKSEPQS
jgi:Cap4 dsDNA endonuclease